MNTTTATTSGVNIRDYFLDKDLSAYSKSSCSYEVVLQNNTDFIISRKTAKSVKELVILISQGQFYFKDVKSGNIEEITLGKLKSYLRDLHEGSIPLEQVLWLPELSKHTVERLETIISNKVFVDMCRHNVLAEINNPVWYVKFWEQNEKLFIKLHSMFPTISDNNSNKYRASFPIIFGLDGLCGYNEAMFFAETLLRSGIEQYGSEYRNNIYQIDAGAKVFFKLLEEPYSLNLRRFIEYIFYDTYSQGIARIDEYFWRTYEDYLRMQIKIYDKIKDKYPKNLRTEHDIIALKVNKVEAMAAHENFAIRSEEISELAYTGKTYSIVVPDTPQQIADEGINLSHCVGCYIDRIIKGDCHILFLRKTRAPDQSLVTLQLSKGRINQAEGNNRRCISEEERKFLQNWGQKMHIQIAA